MKCVVMGGGGFIGSHLTEALLAQGCQVTVFGRPESRYLDYLQKIGANLQIGNFLNPDDLGPAMTGCDVLYHLVSATVPQTSNDDPVHDLNSNVLGTLRLLDL